MANPIATVIDLNGAWASGGVPGPFISVTGNAISVDMSAYGRPFAAGSVLDSSDITMTFGDDGTFSATLIHGLPDTIQWSNGTSWTRFPLPITTVVDLNGQWVSDGTTEPVISISTNGRSIFVAMPQGRPKAGGYVLDFADIFVDFPDDAGYTGRLELPDRIRWSNNSVWLKLAKRVPYVTLFWEISGTNKNLFVSGSGFADGLVTVKVNSGVNEIAHFTAFATNGQFTAEGQGIPCTSGGTLQVAVFDSSSGGTPALKTSALCPLPQP